MTPDTKKPLILVADDDTVIRTVVKYFYQAYGFDVIEAGNGREAVELARSCAPDMILMDLAMPVMDGYAATKLLKADEHVKHIPILIFTGKDHHDAATRTGTLVQGYVRKPFEHSELLHATLHCLTGARHPAAGSD